MLRTLALLLIAGSLGYATPIPYDVSIDTSVTGSQSSLLLTLFDNDPGASTKLAVTNVAGVLREGFSVQTGNVSGSFGGNDLVISDGAPSFQYINGYLELFAIFDKVLSFRISFDTNELASGDLALFGMRGRNGSVINLFSFNGKEEMTVLESKYVTAVRAGAASVPEPPALAELMLLLGSIVAIGVVRHIRQGGPDHRAISRAPHFS